MTSGVTPLTAEAAAAGGATALTIDLLVTLTLILLLCVQEILRVAAGRYSPAAMRVVTVPLLFAFLAIVVRRAMDFLA